MGDDDDAMGRPLEPGTTVDITPVAGDSTHFHCITGLSLTEPERHRASKVGEFWARHLVVQMGAKKHTVVLYGRHAEDITVF